MLACREEDTRIEIELEDVTPLGSIRSIPQASPGFCQLCDFCAESCDLFAEPVLFLLLDVVQECYVGLEQIEEFCVEDERHFDAL